jgi:hypothetical protein
MDGKQHEQHEIGMEIQFEADVFNVKIQKASV